MVHLSFGEQVKIVLSRRNMTIKQLAEEIEILTGMKMSRQNLTQRLGRDNFQEKDMRMIAEILGCPFQLSILETLGESTKEVMVETKTNLLGKPVIKGVVQEETKEVQEDTEEVQEDTEEVQEDTEEVVQEVIKEVAKDVVQESTEEVVQVVVEMEEPVIEEPVIEESVRYQPAIEIVETKQPENQREVTIGEIEPSVKEAPAKEGDGKGDINPYTGYEYKTNSVRSHPKRIGYVQVYDRVDHKWTDMTEWAFLGFQERQKLELGKAYEEPTYLD